VLETPENKPPSLGETGVERSTIPLQKAPLYKEPENSKSSLFPIKTVNLTTYGHPGSWVGREHYSHRFVTEREAILTGKSREE